MKKNAMECVPFVRRVVITLLCSPVFFGTLYAEGAVVNLLMAGHNPAGPHASAFEGNIAFSSPTIDPPSVRANPPQFQHVLWPFMVENRGQFADMDGNPRADIRYVLRSGSMRLFLRNTGLTFVQGITTFKTD